MAWAADNRTLFYTVEDEATKRQYRLYRHVLGRATRTTLVYEEADERFNVGVDRTRSRAYLVLGVAQPHDRARCASCPRTSRSGEWRLVAPRVTEQEYDVDHRGDRLLHPDQRHRPQLPARDRARSASPGRESWTEVVPHRDDVMLEGVDCFRDHLVLLEREGGLPQMSVTDLRTGATHRIALPGAGLHRVAGGQPRVRHPHSSATATSRS